VQSARFAQYLSSSGSRPVVVDNGRERELDLSNVSRILRLTVTLELLGMWAHPKELEADGFIPADVDAVRPLLLSHAAAVFDLLPLQAERIDFLEQRDRIDHEIHWSGDDLDLVALYMHNHLRLAAPGDSTMLFLSHHSIELDPYFIETDRGIKARRPKPVMTKLWEDVIERVETTAEPGWLACCRALLGIGPATQRNLIQEMRRRTARIEKGERASDLAYFEADRGEQALLCAFAFDRAHRDEDLSDVQETLAQMMLENASVSRIVALGFVPRKRMPQEIFSVKRETS
jgi:hypothetical protein